MMAAPSDISPCIPTALFARRTPISNLRGFHGPLNEPPRRDRGAQASL